MSWPWISPLLAQLGNLRDPFASITMEDAREILIGFAWLFAAAFALLICALIARKWLKGSSFDAAPFDGKSQFTLNDLRKLRDDGLMTQEEFDKAKVYLLARGKSILHDPQEDEA